MDSLRALRAFVTSLKYINPKTSPIETISGDRFPIASDRKLVEIIRTKA
jgi:hypothetical protein